MIELTNGRFQCVGLQGSGKSVLLYHLLYLVPDHLVYDPLNEYQGCNRYVPDDRNDTDELNLFLYKMVIPVNDAPPWRTAQGKAPPSLLVIDELNRHCPPKPTPLPAGIGELNDLSRHWGITWGGAFRRPVQVHTDLVELANHLFIFGLWGRNDKNYMEDLISGLSDTVRALPRYHFAVVRDLRVVQVHAPVPDHRAAKKPRALPPAELPADLQEEAKAPTC